MVYYPMPLHTQKAYDKFPTDPVGLAIVRGAGETSVLVAYASLFRH